MNNRYIGINKLIIIITIIEYLAMYTKKVDDKLSNIVTSGDGLQN